MNRREFTKSLATILLEMVEAGDEPVIDYLLRSSEEQNRLFQKGLSKCDGYIKRSNHQSAKAADIYLVKKREDGSVYVDFDWTDDVKTKKWHDRWMELGGDIMISWDKPHFQG